MRAFWQLRHAVRVGLPTALLWGCAALVSCTAGGFANGVFRGDGVAFAVGPVPATWHPVTTENADSELSSFGFRDDADSVTVGGTGRCNRDGDDVPLHALTQHLSLGFTDRTIASEKELQLDGRAALRTELTAALDGVPVHLVLVVIKKDACVYDFWWIAPPTVTNTADFDRFVAGFRTVS